MLEIRKVLNEEMKDALNLVWRVFLEYEAPDYTDEGIKEFKKSIDDVNWVNAREFYGAFQGQGIGRKLYNKIIELNNQEFFTVNSSPYAHEIYKHLGFVDTDTEQCINGLRFYPMKNSKV